MKPEALAQNSEGQGSDSEPDSSAPEVHTSAYGRARSAVRLMQLEGSSREFHPTREQLDDPTCTAVGGVRLAPHPESVPPHLNAEARLGAILHRGLTERPRSQAFRPKCDDLG